MASGLTEVADLVLEDGTGLATANSYTDVATALVYINLRQFDPLQRFTDADESNRVAALIIASAYIDERWCFRGIREIDDDPGPAQALSWPRLDVNGSILYDVNGNSTDALVPAQVVYATIEYAARSIDATTGDAGSLISDPSVPDSANRSVTLERDKLGPLESERRYDSNKSSTATRSFPAPDRILRNSGLVSSVGGAGTAIRN